MRKLLIHPLIVYGLFVVTIALLVKSYKNLREAELVYNRVEELCPEVDYRQFDTSAGIVIRPEGKELE